MTVFKYSNYATSITLCACLLIFISSCSKKEEIVPKTPSVPNGITQEIKDLIYYEGDDNAPIVLINAQSGPDTLLSTAEVDLLFNNLNTEDILIANVHQAQTLDPSIVMTDDITLEQAVDYNSESIETLTQVINFFKAQDRTVYVLGTSFGAFVTQELIEEKGIDIADGYLIMIGRLDINDNMWQALAEGRFGYFENGITPVIDPDPAELVLDRNMGKISAALGMNRYTEQLNDIEDLSSITYVYGATDQFVGRLTEGEVEFLESKNANIIAGSGDHDDTFYEFLGQGLLEAFGIE